MIIYNLSSTAKLRAKTEQFKYVGLTEDEYSNINEILEAAFSTKQEEENVQINDLWRFSNLHGAYSFYPCAVTYNVNTGDSYRYNIGSFDSTATQMLAMKPVNSPWIMNNSSNFSFLQPYRKLYMQESTITTRKNTFGEIEEDLFLNAKSTKTLPITSKIELLKGVLEGITDVDQVLITSKPKNKSQKIRKSNRHSQYRGVSLNGKKWQVMIMGPAKKKYFGGITSESEAAVFYDKLSILTNGLAAKTNFNYRKCDLQMMMAELEQLEPIIST